jgi:RNA polymerase sigma-70 factor (ECF subfamily)
MESGLGSTGGSETQRANFDRALVDLRPRLHRYCARMTGSVIDGEDLVQEVLVRAIDAFSQAGPITHIEGWLFRIAHNTALNFIARRNRERAIFSNEDSQMLADPAQDAENREALTARLHMFMHLPAVQRSSIVLKDVLGYSLEEVCSVTGNSVPAAKANLHRGRARLRQLLQDGDDAPLPVLREPEKSRLRLYVERFNARDFDGIRDLLTEDVRLELVNYTQRKGRGGFDSYLGNYGRSDNWRLAIGFVSGRPAILVEDTAGSSRRSKNFVLVEWRDGMVQRVRDFGHAEYVMTDADIVLADWRHTQSA